MWSLTFIFPIVGLIIKRFLDGGPSPDVRSWIVLGLVSIWALRLAIHIGVRHVGEDFRYVQFRKEWMEFGYYGYLWRAMAMFMAQAFLSVLVNSSALYVEIYSDSDYLIWLDFVGIGVWCIGFLFEWLGDE